MFLCWSPVFLLCFCLFSIAFIVCFSNVWAWSNFSLISFLAYWLSCVFPFLIAHCFPCFYCWEICIRSNSRASLALLSRLKTFYWCAHLMLFLILYRISLFFIDLHFFVLLFFYNFESFIWHLELQHRNRKGEESRQSQSTNWKSAMRRLSAKVRRRAAWASSTITQPHTEAAQALNQIVRAGACILLTWCRGGNR